METLLFVLAAAVAAAVTQGDPAHGRQSPVSDSGAWRPGPQLLWSAALCTVLAGGGGVVLHSVAVGRDTGAASCPHPED